MGCCASTEQLSETALGDQPGIAPSNWVLRRRERLQQQHADSGLAGTNTGFDFSALSEEAEVFPDGGQQSTVARRSRDSDFVAVADDARSADPADGDPRRAAEESIPPFRTAEAIRRLHSERNPFTTLSLLPDDGAVDLSAPVATTVIVGDVVAATTPRQSPTLPRSARVLRFSPAPSLSCSECSRAVTPADDAAGDAAGDALAGSSME